MKKIMLSIFNIILAIGCVTTPLITATPVFAGTACTCTIKKADGSTETKSGETMDAAILNNVCECGGGESISHVLNLVVDIMSVLIGILGVIGITITGIQYLTAGGSEEKTRKAKRRLFEIVIGLAVYAVMYALLSWLLPNN